MTHNDIEAALRLPHTQYRPAFQDEDICSDCTERQGGDLVLWPCVGSLLADECRRIDRETKRLERRLERVRALPAQGGYRVDSDGEWIRLDDLRAALDGEGEKR